MVYSRLCGCSLITKLVERFSLAQTAEESERAHNVRIGRENKKVIYSFDENSPRISAFEIHECMRETVHPEQQEVLNIQVDGQMRLVYIKLVTEPLTLDLVSRAQGHVYYKHTTGEVLKVTITSAGLGPRTIRVDSLPSELPNYNIRGLEL